MKKTLSRLLVIIIAATMVITSSAFVALGDDSYDTENGWNSEEEYNTVCLSTPNGVFEVSAETAAVVENLEGQNYVEGELLVVYEDEVTVEESSGILSATSDAIVDSEVIADLNAIRITLDDDASMRDKIIELSSEEGVAFVQPNYLYELCDDGIEYVPEDELPSDEYAAVVESVNTNDPYRSYQPYQDQVKIQQAWNRVLAEDYSKVRVAILDTGATVSHEDLTDSILKQYCVDVTGTGSAPYPLQPTDVHGHGTHVSSMIGATTNNGIGMAGTATCGLNASSTPLEYFCVDVFYTTKARSSDIAKGIYYSVDSGAKVINMSLGYHRSETIWTDYTIKNAIDSAYNSGVICVCAGGNEYVDSSPHYPSDYDKVIAVCALDTIAYDKSTGVLTPKNPADFCRAVFSCFNNKKDISAPGVYDLGACRGTYYFMDGTSQASPIVASVIALMYMVNPDLSFDDVYRIITSTATDMVYTKTSPSDEDGNNPFTEVAGVGYDIYTGYGLINADACVAAAVSGWSFNAITGVLAITSDDAMIDYTPASSAPWSSYSGMIKSIVIGEKVTKVGAYAFNGCGAVTEVTIPASVTKVGACAFNGCSNLKDVYYASTSAQRQTINIGSDNTKLTGALWHYTPCEHNANVQHYDANAADCTTAGNIEYWQCELCQKYFSNASCTNEITQAQTIVAALGHKLSHHARVEATYTRSGNIEYWTCSRCNKYFKDSQGKTEITEAQTIIAKKQVPSIDGIFSDVTRNDWFYNSVAFVYATGIMKGMGGTDKFAPGSPLQREQLAIILYRLENSPSVTYEPKFYDVPAGEWYTNPIIWAYKKGVITGYQSGYFGVGDCVTREQFATMLYRYAKNVKGISMKDFADISTFPDASQVSDWAYEAMSWAVGNGIITGKKGIYLDPGGNAQRCECATMIERFMNKFGL